MMNGDVNPQQYGGSPPPPPYLPPIPPPPSGWTFVPPPLPQSSTPGLQEMDHWGGVLILSCLVIGVLAGMLELERSRFKSEREDVARMMTSVEILQARNESLGKNLSDPNTQLIHLSSPLAQVSAGLAFNDSLRWGLLICDNLPVLPASQQYEVWGYAGDTANQLNAFSSQPGVSVYPFHFDVSNVKFDRIEVTAGAPVAGQPPLLSGTLPSEH